MPNLFCRYNANNPIGLHPAMGAVTPRVWLRYVYDNYDYTKPRWDKLDQVFADIPTGTKIHAHPLVNRVADPRDWERISPGLEDAIIPIIDRYKDQVDRWTIANELLLTPHCDRITELYKNIRREYPDIELWTGGYGLRKPFRASGIIKQLRVLRESVGLAGFVVVDYFDLNKTMNRPLMLGLGNWLKMPEGVLSRIGIDSPETLSEWQDAIMGKVTDAATAIQSDLITAALDKSFGRITETGCQITLETSVFTGPNPDAKTEARQAEAYRQLLALCDKHGADFCHWNVADTAVGIPWARQRNETECPGFYGRDGAIKDWAVGWLGQ